MISLRSADTTSTTVRRENSALMPSRMIADKRCWANNSSPRARAVVLRWIGDTPGNEIVDDEVLFLTRQETFLRLTIVENAIRILRDVVDEGNLEVQSGLVVRLDDLTEPKLHCVFALVDGKDGHPDQQYAESALPIEFNRGLIFTTPSLS